MTDFEAIYRLNEDPWATCTAWYERRKRAVLIASLPRESYRHALELGCGTGASTRALAKRCDAVWAVDASPTAVDRCRQLVIQDGSLHVHVQNLRLPADWPEDTVGAADLVVVSELAYYFSDSELLEFIDRCLESVAPSGDWAMCHYKADFHDRRQDTDRIHRLVDAAPELDRIVSHDDDQFRLDIWRRQPKGRR